MLSTPAAAALSPELWLIILDIVIGDSINPHEHCTYLNFPRIDLHLRAPWGKCYSPLYAWLTNLRRVCQLFETLLKSSPYFMVADAETADIPTTVRAAYIDPNGDRRASFQRLLADPLKSQRVVLLDLPGYQYWNSSKALLFEILCDHAHLLPNVRSLTFGLHAHTDSARTMAPTYRFWGRINEAFPCLTSLILRGYLRTTYDDPVVKFNHLNILDADFMAPHRTLYFPVLRHVAFGKIDPYDVKNFTAWSHIESFLLRSNDNETRLEWDSMSRLKLFGAPAQQLHVLDSPVEHPLRHLHIYIGLKPRNDHDQNQNRCYAQKLAWLREIIEKFPMVSQITLAFQTGDNANVSWITRDFKDDDLEPMGFFVTESSQWSLTGTIVRKPLSVVLSEETVSTRSRIGSGWDKFCGFATRRLRL